MKTIFFLTHFAIINGWRRANELSIRRAKCSRSEFRGADQRLDAEFLQRKRFHNRAVCNRYVTGDIGAHEGTVVARPGEFLGYVEPIDDVNGSVQWRWCLVPCTWIDWLCKLTYVFTLFNNFKQNYFFKNKFTFDYIQIFYSWRFLF